MLVVGGDWDQAGPTALVPHWSAQFLALESLTAPGDSTWSAGRKAGWGQG